MQLSEISRTSLGKRPDALNHLNGGSFQQDPLITYKDYQYTTYYLDSNPGTRHLHVARRKLPAENWDVLEFDGYDQTEDDGHNVPCLGISHQDGTLHLVWDLHDTTLRYRRSTGDVSSEKWHVESFGGVMRLLPGLEGNEFDELTYPRFLSMPVDQGGALILEIRRGVSGLGDDYLYIYSNGKWSSRGMYLQGVQNNPYINGIDLDENGALHVSWCHRDYVPVTLEQSRQQAGPNGPENNHDLCYAWSPVSVDGAPGKEWYNADGDKLRLPILPIKEATVFDIPKYSGVLNQESQCVAPDGIHVLNRETISGVSTWIHYHLLTRKRKPLPILPQSHLPPRGKLLYFRNHLIALLQTDEDLIIYDVKGEREVSRVKGAGGPNCQEVLFDRYRKDVLSLFLGIRGELVVVDLA